MTIDEMNDYPKMPPAEALTCRFGERKVDNISNKELIRSIKDD